MLYTVLNGAFIDNAASGGLYVTLSLTLFLFPSCFHSVCLSAWSLVSVFLCVCPLDEVYAQKLKGKALSEELDLALNDMTTL